MSTAAVNEELAVPKSASPNKSRTLTYIQTLRQMFRVAVEPAEVPENS